MITLDGVMQAPGGPGEDTSGDFKYGGWVTPYFDEAYSQYIDKQLQPADLLLGKTTYEIFAGYWPQHIEGWPSINDSIKYVLADKIESDWENTVVLKTIQDVKEIKKSDGPDIQVHGSGQLIQSLLKEDLVDELWLKIHPVTLGHGKRLFGDGTMPMAFTLIETFSTPSGVIMANYKRSGEVKTGTVGE